MSEKDNPAPTALRVIVIEDNEDDTVLLMRQLKKAGMASYVKLISDGQEAVKFFAENTAEMAAHTLIIFLDLKLPSISGLEVLRNLKQNGAIQHIPVIVLTSSNNPQDLEECQKLKVAHYVEKPITFPTFSKSMADLLFQSPQATPSSGTSAIPSRLDR